MNNVVLCGFMGCGKTTVGKKLADRLDAEFIDMDAYIEEKSGMPVFQIFEVFGESKFRAFEAEAARELSRKRGAVIASGGGAVLNPKNVRAFKAGGIIVLLDVPLSVLSKRLANDFSRPLLNRSDREKAMQQLYLARMPVYRAAADRIIHAGSRPPEALAQEIARIVQNREK